LRLGGLVQHFETGRDAGFERKLMQQPRQKAWMVCTSAAGVSSADANSRRASARRVGLAVAPSLRGFLVERGIGQRGPTASVLNTRFAMLAAPLW